MLKSPLLLLLFLPCLCAAQLPKEDGTVAFVSIIELDSSYKVSDIHSLAKEFIQTKGASFNRANSENNYSPKEAIWGVGKARTDNVDALFRNDSPLKIDEPNRLSAKAIFKYSGRDALQAAIRLMYIEFIVNMYIKDGKYKLEMTNFSYTHYNNRLMQQSQIGTWKDEGPCSSKGTFDTLLGCDKVKKDFDVFYPAIIAEMDKFKQEIVTFIAKKNKSKADF